MSSPKKLRSELDTYLKSRWTGSQDWIWFHEKPDFESKAFLKELGVDPSKPCIGLLTNVLWDAQLHYPANAFPNLVTWLLQSIEYFTRRPDLQLLIRVHPAEIRGTVPSRQRVVDEIKKAFPQLPPNIFVIEPESTVSTYAAMMACDSVIIFGTKNGVELSAVGVPVIVAGEAWIRNKGITLDAASAPDYFKILDRLPLKSRSLPEQVDRAKRYAFHFFFRRMIPVKKVIRATGAWPPYVINVESVRELAPGKDLGLDVICDGILKGADFIYPAENNLG